MGVAFPWRFAAALLLGAVPPVAMALVPAPVSTPHRGHAIHGEHLPPPATLAAQSPIPAGVGKKAWDRQLPPWPIAGRVLAVGEGQPYRLLADALAAAVGGDHIIIHGGLHPGPVRLDRPIWIEGRGETVIEGPGTGTVIAVTAPGARVTGLIIRKGGGSLDSEDSGVFIKDAPGTVVADCDLSEVQFGIVAKNSENVLIAGNSVVGRPGDLSLNGDGIRIWYSHGARVFANTVRYTRQILVEQTKNAHVSGNAAVGGRLGLHFMQAPGATAARNYLGSNSTGLYVMYGADTTLTHNWVVDSRGPSGYGLGVKEADNLRLESNWLLGNRVGIYLDNSPLDPNRPNRISGNLVGYNDIGLLVTPSTHSNEIAFNDFMENLQQVGSAGGSQIGANTWSTPEQGNYWSDYAGYDADGDGIGDLPQAPARVFEGWMDRHPMLRLFWLTPAATAIDLAAHAFPLAAPEPVFTDWRPAMAPAHRRETPWSTYSL